MPASAAEHAPIRAYIACNLAREALPELPQATAAAVEDAVRTFCNVVGEELRMNQPRRDPHAGGTARHINAALLDPTRKGRGAQLPGFLGVPVKEYDPSVAESQAKEGR
jgi:hypothetical protein